MTFCVLHTGCYRDEEIGTEELEREEKHLYGRVNVMEDYGLTDNRVRIHFLMCFK